MQDKTLGQKLKTIRTDKNLTLKTVAKALNMDASTISKYENNHRKLTHDTIQTFANYYGVDITTLLNAKQSNAVKTYSIKTPFITPLNKDVIISLIIFFIAVSLWALFQTSFFLIMTVFFGFTIIIRKFFLFILKPARPIHQVEVHKEETLFYEHPISERMHKNNQTLDITLHIWLTFIMIILTSFYAPYFVDDVDMYIVISTLMINMGLYLYIIIITLLKKIDKKMLEYETTNRYVNTFKYRIHHLITTVTFVIYMLYYAMVKTEFSTSLQIIIYIILIIYLIATQFYSYQKHQFARKYRLFKK